MVLQKNKDDIVNIRPTHIKHAIDTFGKIENACVLINFL